MTKLKRHKRINLGSVSSGTMRAEDLIPAFIAELREQRPLHREHRKLIRSIEAEMREYRQHVKGMLRAEQDTDSAYFESDLASEAVSGLFDALGEYALEGMYFGAHPGDGADYGFWLDDSWVDDFDGERVSDTSEVPRGYSGLVLHTNDHGNMTLYRATNGRLREVWAIV